MKDKTYYLGVDLGKQSSYFVIKDRQGVLQKEMKVFHDKTSIRQTLDPYRHASLKVVMEATTGYYWMYQVLEELGCQVTLAHPLKTRAIADAKVKTDRLDANILCDLLRGNLVPASYIPTEKIRNLREIVRQRVRLIQMRTQVKNQTHSLLTKLNYHHKATDLFGRKGRMWFAELSLPDVFDFQRRQLLAQLDHYNRLALEVDRKIREMLKAYPEAQKLMNIFGVGQVAAATLVAEIGPIERFRFPKKLVSYAGIAPGLYESGKTSHRRGITHEGNSYLRWILCEITQIHIRKPGPLRQFFLRLKDRIGYSKALVATSRKLLLGIYFVLKGRPFAPYFAG